MWESHKVKLNNGYEMPIIGLGTWQSSPEAVENAVTVALNARCRHIDAAYAYFNEDAVGRALTKWLNANPEKREELFITSKLPFIGMHSGKVEHFVNISLRKLGLDYLDLYLIHFPVAVKYKDDNEIFVQNEDGTLALDSSTSLETIWSEMEDQVKAGRVKSIGLSNFNRSQILRILKVAEIKPTVLQIELHAYLQQKTLRELCKKTDIVVESYSSLASPGRDERFIANKDAANLLNNVIVKQLAERCNKTPAQILLRHLIQHNIVVIPKSITPSRILENLNVFDFFLTPSEMEALDGLDQGIAGRTLDFTFFGHEIKDHPEYPFNEK